MHYLPIPPGYRMWQKKETKLELAASMVCQIMSAFSGRKNVILLCDSWYVKRNLVSIVDEYENHGLIGNARSDSVLYDLPPQRTEKRGRPAQHGKKLSIQDDFTLSDENIGDYYIGARRVLTNILGRRTVLAYVTSADKETGRRCFSAQFSRSSSRSSVHGKKNPLNQTGSNWMQYIPLMLYAFRWNIEVSYYEQKTFWSLYSYMVRRRKGIEMLVNLINIAYCVIKILPYQDEAFHKYQTESVQEFRFALSEQIRQQVFYAIFMEKN